MNLIIKDWKKNLTNVGLTEDVINLYLNSIEIMIKNDVPIVLDFNHLCKLLGRTSAYLATVINSSKCHYREFKIPKRKGGTRIICSPYPALLECQLWIYEYILKKVSIHFAAQAFTIDKSIITNAKVHKDGNHLLKMDLEDFFTSIKINRIISIFKKLGYSHKVSFYLAQICCFKDFLPQGAPTSPALSNLVASNLDHRLFSLAKSFDYKYTRYADDLAFSGERIPVKFISYVSDIIEEEGFIVNSSKTRLLGEGKRKILTGISINTKELKLPRDYKRNLRKEIHFIRKYGHFSHLSKMKNRNPLYLESLLGKITFWLSIEPNNVFALKAQDYIRRLLRKRNRNKNLIQ